MLRFPKSSKSAKFSPLPPAHLPFRPLLASTRRVFPPFEFLLGTSIFGLIIFLFFLLLEDFDTLRSKLYRHFRSSQSANTPPPLLHICPLVYPLPLRAGCLPCSSLSQARTKTHYVLLFKSFAPSRPSQHPGHTHDISFHRIFSNLA